MISSKQRAFLRSKATALTTSFQIGKGGVSENMLSSIEDALAAHEMVKIRCLENCVYSPREAADGIAEALEAETVQVIGTKFILFKISPNHRIYNLEKLCLIEEKKKEVKKAPQKSGAPKFGRNSEFSKSGPSKPAFSKEKGEESPKKTRNYSISKVQK